MRSFTTIFIFVSLFFFSSCNRGLIQESDIGMTMADFSEKVGEYDVLEIGHDYGVFAIGEGRSKRIVHFKNDKLVNVVKE